jgi:hypothetical protein
MSFGMPDQTGGDAPPSAPAAPMPGALTLGSASAKGTAVGAAPPPGGAPPPPAAPASPPVGGPWQANPVVAPHMGQPSIGTHASASPLLRGNPTFEVAR